MQTDPRSSCRDQGILRYTRCAWTAVWRIRKLYSGNPHRKKLAALIAAATIGLSVVGWAGEYRWRVVGIIDGDSLRVEIPGIPEELSPMIVRIRGIDAPEAGSKAKCEYEADLAIRATEMLEALLRGGTPVFSSPGWDKYGGRILATVTVNGQNVGDRLIAAHLARAYDGQGARLGWCE